MGAVAADGITVVRKSFDSRKGRPKVFKYVVDVTRAAARAAGAGRIRHQGGQIERCTRRAATAIVAPPVSGICACCLWSFSFPPAGKRSGNLWAF